MLLASLARVAHAAEAPAVTIQASKEALEVGEKVEVSIGLSSAINNVAGLEIKVGYDPLKFTFNQDESRALNPGSPVNIQQSELDSNVVNLVYVEAAPNSEKDFAQGEISKLSFTAKVAGPSMFSIKALAFDNMAIPMGLGSGSDIALSASPSGNLLMPKATLDMAAQITAESGTEFNAIIDVEAWGIDGARIIEGVVRMPSGVSVLEVIPSEALSGGSVRFNMDAGVLRFAYLPLESDGRTIASNATQFPASLFTLRLKLTSSLADGTALTFSIDSLRVLTDAKAPAFYYDVAQALASTTAKTSSTPPGEDPVFVPFARVLFTGDGFDLIPQGKKGVAINFLGLEGTPAILFSGQPVFYNAEMSSRYRTTIYLALLEPSVALESLNDADNYSATTGSPQAVRFGKTSGASGPVNAQDALNTLSAWLRKTPAPEGAGILAANVSGDGRIDSVDVLGIVENYIDGKPFRILVK
jgi:hypothetical protein